MKLLALRRLIHIQRTAVRYQLDELLLDLPLPWWLRSLLRAMPWRWLPRTPLAMSRGERLARRLPETD